MGTECKTLKILTPYFKNNSKSQQYDLIITCLYCNQQIKDVIVTQLDFFQYIGYCIGCDKKLNFNIRANSYRCKIDEDLVLFIWIDDIYERIQA